MPRRSPMAGSPRRTAPRNSSKNSTSAWLAADVQPPIFRPGPPTWPETASRITMLDKKHIPHLLMVFPFLALFAVFFLYPIVSGFVYSFYDWNATTTSRFVGLANYQRIIHSRDFSKAMWNLGSYIVITVPVGIAVPFFPPPPVFR